MKLTSIILLGAWSLQTGAAIIPRSALLQDAHILSKRDVTWATGKNAEAKKSECSAEYKTILENTMPEVAKLAAAGSKGLDLMQDYMKSIEEKTEDGEFAKLDKKDKNRIKETYIALYGAPRKSSWEDQKTQIGEQKAMLDKIAGTLNKADEKETRKNWPSQIRFFCDSTYYQDVDLSGKNYETQETLKDDEKRVFDTDLEKWTIIKKFADCSQGGQGRPAWTTPFEAENQDRITFCPEWFTRSQSTEAGPSFTDLKPEQDIQEGNEMSIFHKKTGRMMLHEHMHTWTWMGTTRKGGVSADTRLDDVEGTKSYGFVNAARLVQENGKNLRKPGRNIENLVFWCIAMFYDGWDWHTGKAEVPK